MQLNRLIRQKNISLYRLAKNCGLPYTTVNDIFNGKAQLGMCSAETVYKLSRELNVSMEQLIAPYLEQRISFELFKSSVCHRLKTLGDIGFIIDTLEKDEISMYFQRKWYPESLYLLAMLDYISRINHIPLCTRYDVLRQSKLSKVVYPSGILAAFAVAEDERIKKNALRTAIPEFMRFNIAEGEVRDAV